MVSAVPSPADYDFELPPSQIAQRPPPRRRAAKLLHLSEVGGLGHHQIADLPELLQRDGQPPPLVVVNDSKVVPARVFARRDSGKRFELLIVDPAPLGPGARFHAWIRGAKKLALDEELAVEGTPLRLRFCGRRQDERDSRACVLEILAGELLTALDSAGELPLPPYIARPEGPNAQDLSRYQTVFARDRGSVAAPTAGLHFDEALLEQIDHARVTLHVGPGTFLPLEVEDVSDHRVGAERYSITAEAAARIEDARAQGRAIVAVGTTVTRTLESVAAAHEGRILPGSGSTQLVITPRHSFRVVDRLLTNFHLPRSSLLMLVCSFAGRERVLEAYRAAVAAHYRFYSYGDCMLVEPGRSRGSVASLAGS